MNLLIFHASLPRYRRIRWVWTFWRLLISSGSITGVHILALSLIYQVCVGDPGQVLYYSVTAFPCVQSRSLQTQHHNFIFRRPWVMYSTTNSVWHVISINKYLILFLCSCCSLFGEILIVKHQKSWEKSPKLASPIPPIPCIDQLSRGKWRWMGENIDASLLLGRRNMTPEKSRGHV